MLPIASEVKEKGKRSGKVVKEITRIELGYL